jgi:hypothetical protein
MSASGLSDVLRPFLWLALAAFLVGFLSYLAVGGATASARPEATYAPRVSAPVTGEWNLPKRV